MTGGEKWYFCNFRLPKTTSIAVVLLAALVVGGYWYWSPFLAVKQLQSAADERNAKAFSEGVDFPKLRESLKQQFSTMLAEKMRVSNATGVPQHRQALHWE